MQGSRMRRSRSPLRVRHRTLIAECPAGSVACFPPPHQFFFPRDLTDNLRTVWYGKDHRGLELALRLRHPPGRARRGLVRPRLFNAPPGTDQRLGVFYLLSTARRRNARPGSPLHARRSFPEWLPGYRTFTSHWHMATAMAATCRRRPRGTRTTPDLVPMFKQHGRGDRALLPSSTATATRKTPALSAWPRWRRCSPSAGVSPTARSCFFPAKRPTSASGSPGPGKEAGHWLCPLSRGPSTGP